MYDTTEERIEKKQKKKNVLNYYEVWDVKWEMITACKNPALAHRQYRVKRPINANVEKVLQMDKI